MPTDEARDDSAPAPADPPTPKKKPWVPPTMKTASARDAEIATHNLNGADIGIYS
jgi:hypothetical protein